MVIRLGILPIGLVETKTLLAIKDGLPSIFPRTTALIVKEQLPLLESYLDHNRKQYRSNQLLAMVQGYALKRNFDRIMGVLDADIFVPELNFVFGEAMFPGKASLISLWRLKPQYYGDPANVELLLERTVKEAVHEIGHTLGLRHCPRSSCVMHFSNSISDTDKKQKLFCDECYLQASIAIDCLG